MSPQRTVEHATDHTLDAIAINATEAQRLHNPTTPEADSVLEYVELLPMPDHTRRVLRGAVTSVWQLNEREGDASRRAAQAFADRCRREHRYPVKQIAHELRGLLRETDGLGYVRLVCTIRRLLAHEQVGRDVLLSPAVAHELGAGPTRKMHVLVAAVERAELDA